MANRCRSTIGKRPANTTCDTSHLILTDENGASAKVEQSTRNLISCDPCTNGVRRSSRMRSGCDQPEIEPSMAPPGFLPNLVRRGSGNFLATFASRRVPPRTDAGHALVVAFHDLNGRATCADIRHRRG